MKKKSKTTIIVIGIAIAVIAVFFLGRFVKKITTFKYSKHLDEQIITVDNRDISLREFGYYIYEIEASVQNQALIYDPKDPMAWWNAHFAAGPNSVFVCDFAKKTAVNLCISDEIYYREATAQGISLTPEEESDILNETGTMLSDMNEEQRDITGLDGNVILQIKRKHALALKYADYLIQNGDLDGYYGDPYKLLNWDGEYYEGVILPQHTYSENEKLLKNLTFGSITVNM